MRQAAPSELPEVRYLADAPRGDGDVYTIGLVVQEFLQGFSGASAEEVIVAKLSSLAMVVPDLIDDVEEAKMRNVCLRKSVQIETIDALIARLAIRYDLAILTTDRDIRNEAKHVNLRFVI